MMMLMVVMVTIVLFEIYTDSVILIIIISLFLTYTASI